MKAMETRRITYLGLFTAAALVLHVVESALPPLLVFAPGAKMGLGNVVSLVAVFILGVADAYFILTVRCLLGAVFGGGIWSLAYSLPAGLISLTVEVLLIKLLLPRISLISVSFTGALLHNAVQLFVASVTVGVNLLPVLPLFMLASVIAGLFVGFATYFTIKYLPPKTYFLPVGICGAAAADKKKPSDGDKQN